MTVEKVYYNGNLHTDEEPIASNNPALLSMILAKHSIYHHNG